MEVVNDLKQIPEPFKNAVVTAGNFDGVHIGHQALFRQAIEKARSLKGTSVAITFEPHPGRVLSPNNYFPLLTLYEQKVGLIGAAGIDVLVCVPFTRAFAATPARTFVRQVLCETMGMKAAIVGPDHSFGKGKGGSISLLKEMGAVWGFEVIVSRWVELGGQRISSTGIRKIVKEGKIEKAATLLGRHYQIKGTVVHGRERGGKVLGFPTANVKLDNEICPKKGVYAVTVECNDTTYEGVINIGHCPTFGSGELTAEVHVLDFDQDIYGCPIKVNFVRRLREEKKYPRPEELILQIREDVKQAREILSH